MIDPDFAPNQMLSTLTDAFPLPVLVIGSDEMVAAANAPLRALLGDHVLGRHYITALRQPTLLEQVETVLHHRVAAVARYLGREAGRDTNYVVQITVAGPLTVLTFEDRTAAEDVGQFRRDFVANVSHELRTPLTALLGFIETLRGAARDDPDARDRFLGIMEREAGRMTRLVDDLLSLSRVEANERVKPSEMVVLSDIVSATIAEMAPLLDTARVDILFEDASHLALVPAAPEELRQVIVNLIENAVKYAGTDTQVKVAVSAVADEPRLRGKGLRVSVQDTGPGIAPYHIARLTERFYRVDDHRSREVGGTGLGLAIVKHIINRHRGRLVIDSTLGQGTTMTVILPVA